MDYIFFAENSICNDADDHEHGIKFHSDLECTQPADKFTKDAGNFYVVLEGSPYVTYTHNDSPEQLQEVERIKNYIDSLPIPYIDYEELEGGLRVDYYSTDLPTNQWLDYNNEWQSDILPCTIMQGHHKILFSHYITDVPGNYTLKYAIIDSSIEMNSETTKLVFINGKAVTMNGNLYDGDTCQVVSGNVHFTTTERAYVVVIEDAV